jgi:hypothetical protein
LDGSSGKQICRILFYSLGSENEESESDSSSLNEDYILSLDSSSLTILIGDFTANDLQVDIPDNTSRFMLVVEPGTFSYVEDPFFDSEKFGIAIVDLTLLLNNSFLIAPVELALCLLFF